MVFHLSRLDLAERTAWLVSAPAQELPDRAVRRRRLDARFGCKIAEVDLVKVPRRTALTRHIPKRRSQVVSALPLRSR
jgi:hypothetical protein